MIGDEQIYGAREVGGSSGRKGCQYSNGRIATGIRLRNRTEVIHSVSPFLSGVTTPIEYVSLRARGRISS